MYLKKEWSKKSYKININFEEAMMLYRLGNKTKNRTKTTEKIKSMMYDFGYYSNGVDPKQLYQVAFYEDEVFEILEEIEYEENMSGIKEKIEKEIGRNKEVFVVKYEEWNHGEGNKFKVLDVFDNLNEAIEFVGTEYNKLELSYSDEDDASFKYWGKYKTIDIEIEKITVKNQY